MTTTPTPIFPQMPIPPADGQYSARWATDLTRILQQQQQAALIGRLITTQAYTLTNNATLRTLDPGTSTLANTINVLCTLLTDLRNKGLLP